MKSLHTHIHLILFGNIRFQKLAFGRWDFQEYGFWEKGVGKLVSGKITLQEIDFWGYSFGKIYGNQVYQFPSQSDFGSFSLPNELQGYNLITIDFEHCQVVIWLDFAA